ncbi:hypothetical protein BDQ17DRAFT_1413226 [Cyathus striatus]|nr:hypothetical protein BDQ17DRAFT_1413226 [Cyathus striatus]
MNLLMLGRRYYVIWPPLLPCFKTASAPCYPAPLHHVGNGGTSSRPYPPPPTLTKTPSLYIRSFTSTPPHLLPHIHSRNGDGSRTAPTPTPIATTTRGQRPSSNAHIHTATIRKDGGDDEGDGWQEWRQWAHSEGSQEYSYCKKEEDRRDVDAPASPTTTTTTTPPIHNDNNDPPPTLPPFLIMATMLARAAFTHCWYQERCWKTW